MQCRLPPRSNKRRKSRAQNKFFVASTAAPRGDLRSFLQVENHQKTIRKPEKPSNIHNMKTIKRQTIRKTGETKPTLRTTAKINQNSWQNSVGFCRRSCRNAWQRILLMIGRIWASWRNGWVPGGNPGTPKTNNGLLCVFL